MPGDIHVLKVSGYPVPNNITGTLKSFTDWIYHACGNTKGIHIQSINVNCRWKWNDNSGIYGEHIEIYCEIDVNKQIYCDSENFVNVEV